MPSDSFDAKASALIVRDAARERKEESRRERQAVATQKARLKQMRRPTEWPIDAETLERSGRVQPEEVQAPAEPKLPPITFYKAEAAAIPRGTFGVVPVDPNLQIFRRSQFEREQAENRSARQWTEDYVDVRLIEAVKVAMRTIGKMGPRMFGSAMPRPLIEHSDMVSQAENRELRKTTARLLRRYGPPSAVEKKRADEADAWPLEYLQSCDPKVRMMVQFGALWKASNASIAIKCRDLGMSRQSFYTTRKTGLHLIVCGLVNSGRVPL